MLRFSQRFGVVALAAATLTLAGCNSGGGSTTSQPACSLPTGVSQVALVYPSNGSTGNTTQLAQVIIATNAALPATFDVVLTYLPSAIYGGGQFGGYITPAATPFPTPNTLPTFLSPTYYSSAFNISSQPLPPGQTITVNYNDVSSSCNPTAIGSFGT